MVSNFLLFFVTFFWTGIIFVFFNSFGKHSFITLSLKRIFQGIIQTKIEVGIRFWAPNLGLSPTYD